MKPKSGSKIKIKIKRPGSLTAYAKRVAPGCGKRGAFTKSGKLRMKWLQKIKKNGTSLRKKQANFAINFKRIGSKRRSKFGKMNGNPQEQITEQRKPNRTLVIRHIKDLVKEHGLPAATIAALTTVLYLASKSSEYPFTQTGKLSLRWLTKQGRQTPQQINSGAKLTGKQKSARVIHDLMRGANEVTKQKTKITHAMKLFKMI